jgi:hypothetical protein
MVKTTAEPLSESSAISLLTQLFEAAGFKIKHDTPISINGAQFNVDGWDKKAKVGFEYLSTEKKDHEDITLEEYEVIMDAQTKGQLRLLVVDEAELTDAQQLTALASKFLHETNHVTPPKSNKHPSKRSKMSDRLKELEDRVSRLEYLLNLQSEPADCLPPLPARLLESPPAPHIPPAVTCRVTRTC